MQFENGEVSRDYEISYKMQSETKSIIVRLMFYYYKEDEKCVVCDYNGDHITIYHKICENENILRAFEETCEYIAADYTVWFRNSEDYNYYYINSIKKLDTPEEIARQDKCMRAMKNAAAAAAEI